MSATVRLLSYVLSTGLLTASLSSSARGDGPIRKPSYDPQAEVVALFDGIEREQLSVRVSPHGAFSSKVFITNHADKPLTVALPAGVVAVHVLKQQLPPGGLFDDDNALGFGDENQASGAGQSVGGNLFGPFNQGQPNNIGANAPFGNQFPGNGFFSIPPEKTVQIGLATVCLDHGRPEPSGRMTYVLRRVEDHTDDPVLRQLIRDYDPRKDDRMALQAAVWHERNELSWKQLAAKTIRRGPVRYRYFTRTQVEAAQELVSAAEELVSERGETSDEATIARSERRR